MACLFSPVILSERAPLSNPFTAPTQRMIAQRCVQLLLLIAVLSTGISIQHWKVLAEVASVEFLMSSELCLCSLLKRVVIELAGISLSIAAALSHNSIILSHNSITANCLTFCHHQLSPCDTGAKTKLSHNTDASS